MTDGQTERRTDRILLAIPCLHYMQRGKNITTSVLGAQLESCLDADRERTIRLAADTIRIDAEKYRPIRYRYDSLT